MTAGTRAIITKTFAAKMNFFITLFLSGLITLIKQRYAK
jgi:hypothetical protein